MRLTSFTDYSLRVLMFVAARPGRQVTIGEIAAAFAISESHLTKVVNHLGKHGWLVNVRGRGGGMRLACPAADISVGAVVRSAEAAGALVECFKPRGNRCVITPVCALRGVLAEALEGFYAALDGTTLCDITRNRGRLQRALGIA
ncbi:MAG: Rrf2 family transcriptional regulator [Gammaproteobacteria bacterium]|nr:Rrf2 family transcriptional regulator [Gammaproteobacteria bacterium]